eukprot:m.117173 g.117173  ORF g.117173 m.117173 type:complete len:298 (+) comp12868_c0_seq1:803-1696(+)
MVLLTVAVVKQPTINKKTLLVLLMMMMMMTHAVVMAMGVALMNTNKVLWQSVHSISYSVCIYCFILLVCICVSWIVWAVCWDFERGVLQSIGFKEFAPLFEHLYGTNEMKRLNCCRENKSLCCGNNHLDTDMSMQSLLKGQESSTSLCCKVEGSVWELFENYLRDDKETYEVLNQCVDKMKQQTRRYSRKQTQWIRNRVCRERDGMYVYRLDATDLGRWEENVYDKAKGIVERALAHDMVPSNVALKPYVDDGSKISKWRKYHCETCDKTLNGDHEWEVHLKTKKHHRRRRKRHQQK